MPILGNPPIRESIVDENGKPTIGFAKWLSNVTTKIGTVASLEVAADSDNSTVSVTSADIAAATSPDSSTVTGTATTGGDGFANATEFNNAITAINTIKTLTNELKTINATVRTLNNELKADVNTLVTDLNDLKTKLRAAGFIA